MDLAVSLTVFDIVSISIGVSFGNFVANKIIVQ